MPLVVVDTSLSLPATLSPSGMARRFWVLLALGATSHESERLQLELDELTQIAAEHGGSVSGLNSLDSLMAQARRRRDTLRKLLPPDTPEDWVAIGSPPLFDEYERKLSEIGTKINPKLRPTDIPRLRRQLQAVCAVASPPFDPAETPTLTRDRKDDPILYTALLADADLLISDDKDLVPNRRSHIWKHHDRSVMAVTFHELVIGHLEPQGTSLHEIDGTWLEYAYR